ncbi:MAG: isoleucine--tRNA ligase [Coriobacteriia bacterium]|nr:isoleucine--tRNA ligase [Coriobacteriia bacterium]
MNLPKTDFPMRASLSKREPQWLERWESDNLYARILEKHADDPRFILHDGPPYANGHIHMGTAYNKVLKDLIIKYKTMRGHHAPYVPGWDCHGQPIEHQVEKDLGSKAMAKTGQAELRALCREYALRFVDVQRSEFKRLGVLGDWEDPYLTLKPEYEAGNVEIFKKMYLDGSVYKGRKPIHWCIRCRTALAEAEIEYADEASESIYVAFAFTSVTPWDGLAPDGGSVSVLIWTTTPWTLPANVAVTLAENAAYVGVMRDGRVLVIAEELVGAVAEAVDWDAGSYEVVGPAVVGAELSGLTYAQPVHDGVEGVIITGAHVDLSTGTGAVHTAPGHGEDDYLVGLGFNLPMPMPVTDDGTFDAGGGPFEGLGVLDANPKIVEWLRERGVLIASDKISHSYPHCWRCKKPVIFRATEQWFVSMDATRLRAQTLRAINEVEWIPGWSVNRISAMVSDRPDWCISRQRAWGVPIPVFTCTGCGETVATEEGFDAVIRLFKAEGADAWFIREPSEYLPETVSCPRCGGKRLMPEKDIVDVWWESGVSHTSVLEARPELHRPAGLYLEGSDQHRGWFQSSLLTGVGAYGTAPYERVLTHGFTVDGDGRKMSKSLGNTIAPLDVIERSGADIIRLWVASADYGQDVSISAEILDRTSEAYRRIRNTFRFLLSNLYDYEADDALGWEDLSELDRYALAALSDLSQKVTAHNDAWRFHNAHRAVLGYVGELSNVYLDVLKDRLYADGPASASRRAAQTVLARTLGVLVRMLAPVLAFTCEEVWDFMPVSLKDAESVHLSDWPSVEVPAAEARALKERYRVVLEAREAVTKALEDARAGKHIGKSQEAAVIVSAAPAVAAVLAEVGAEKLAELFIVGTVAVEESAAGDGACAPATGDTPATDGAPATDGTHATDTAPAISVSVSQAAGEKCPRCWNVRALGADPAFPEVCDRCAAVLAEAEASRATQ